MTSIWLTPPIGMPQTDSVQSQQATAPSPEDKPKPATPLYFSPIVRIDPKTEIAVWEVRNPETGAIEQQWPPDHTINAYRAQIPASPFPQFAEGALAGEVAPVSVLVTSEDKAQQKG